MMTFQLKDCSYGTSINSHSRTTERKWHHKDSALISRNAGSCHATVQMKHTRTPFSKSPFYGLTYLPSLKPQIPQNYNTISRNKQAISGIQELIGPEGSSSHPQARAPGNGHEISPRPGLELGFMAWVSGPDKTDEAERQRAEGGDTDLVGGGRRRAVVMGRGEGTRNPIRWRVSRRGVGCGVATHYWVVLSP
jgi:hypothetical protein